MERPERPSPVGEGKTAIDFPDQLGRYSAIAALGDGGMAQVFLAMQRGPYASNKLVVIKRVKAESRHDPNFQQMFVDEARIAMLLSHPNIVNTYDLVADGDALYLTMEFIEGHSLLETMKRVGRAGVPRELHVWILSKVLGALAYAHTLRDLQGSDLHIVHRDVSPSNVLLTYRGEVKLLDFGIAKAAGRMSTTHDGMLKGKVRYMAPEQCLRQPVTARSDLYSVGVMLWEGLARERMHPNATPVQIAEAHARGLRKPIEEAWPNVPPALVEVLRRALAIDPLERYASASEFQGDLQDYLSSLPPTTQATSTALSKLVSEAFALERARLRETIVARVAESSGGVLSGLTSPLLSAVDSGGSRTHLTPSAPPSVNPPAPAATSDRKRLGLLAIGGAILVGAISAGVGFRQVGPAPGSVPPPPPQARTQAAAPVAATPPASPISPPAPAGRVAEPAVAPAPPAVPLVEPVAARSPVSPAAPGARLDKPRPKPAVPAPVRATRRSAAPTEGAGIAATGPAVPRTQPGQALPPPARTAAPASHEPGMDLGRPDSRRAGTRTIDERDPYAP